MKISKNMCKQTRNHGPIALNYVQCYIPSRDQLILQNFVRLINPVHETNQWILEEFRTFDLAEFPFELIRTQAFPLGCIIPGTTATSVVTRNIFAARLVTGLPGVANRTVTFELIE